MVDIYRYLRRAARIYFDLRRSAAVLAETSLAVRVLYYHRWDGRDRHLHMAVRSVISCPFEMSQQFWIFDRDV